MIYLISNQTQIENFSNIKSTTLLEMFDYFIKKDSIDISIDTETEGFDPHTNDLICIQIGDKDDQFVIDTNVKGWVPYIKALLESPTKTILMHNAKFDLRFLYKYGIYPVNIYDTFLAECILTTGYTDKERDVSLKGVALDRLDVYLPKEIRGVIHREGLTPRVIEYAAKDIEYLGDIKKNQLKELYEHKLDTILALENQVVKVFAKMEYHGVPINTHKWKEVANRVIQEKNNVENKLDEIIYNLGTKNLPERNSLTKYCKLYKQGSLFEDIITRDRKTYINWSSNQQKLKVLTQEFKIDIKSVDDKTLRKVKDKHPLVPLLLEYSKLAKLESSFGMDFLKLINSVTGRVHPEYWQILSTGRISVSNPKYVGAC